jgi:hypothetical protein
MGKNQDPGKHPGSATLQIGMFYKKIQTVKIIGKFFSLLFCIIFIMTLKISMNKQAKFYYFSAVRSPRMAFKQF